MEAGLTSHSNGHASNGAGNAPKISVLLDNCNYAQFLGSAIESVLAQSYRNLELIIVDDGSTDQSRQVIAAYTDPRIITVFKQNGGQGSAFKAGLARATGEYVAFLDADDFWDSNKLEQCVQVLNSESDIILLNHSYRMVDANGVPTAPPFQFRTSGHYDLAADIRRLDLEFSLVPTSFFLGRRKECLQIEFDDHQWRIGADTPFFIGLGLRGKAYNLTETLASYRVHGANLWYGRDTKDFMFRHYRRFYNLANLEMERLGKSERFHFSQSEFALNHQVLHSNRYTPRGIYHRLRKKVVLRMRSENRKG
jgi:glycosyltransferase involved in cell wall biosynthesis